MHSKKCTNCGADNDPLFTNCMFCKTALPVIDLNSMSNENLIQNAAEWIGKMGTFYTVQGKDFNVWTMKDYRRFDANEIEGLAYRYLSLLQVRAATNIEVLNSYNHLLEQFNKKKNNVFVKMGGGDKKKAVLWFFLLFIIGIIYLGVHTATSKDANEVEIGRLSVLEQQVITDLRQKRYDDALVLLNGLNYSISWAGKDDSIAVQGWRNKKNGYLQTINQLRHP